eukprot:scaffold61638_cov19-Tisochrysis_lutea.AAC.1
MSWDPVSCHHEQKPAILMENRCVLQMEPYDVSPNLHVGTLLGQRGRSLFTLLCRSLQFQHLCKGKIMNPRKELSEITKEADRYVPCLWKTGEQGNVMDLA